MNSKIILLAMSTCFLASSVQALETVKIGVLNFEQISTYRPTNDNVQAKTIEYLRKTIPNIDFQVYRFTSSELEKAIKNQEINFFLSSSGFYVALQKDGIRDIGTLVSVNVPDPNRCVAGTIFVHKANTTLQTIKSLKGTTLVSTSPKNFMTYQLGMAAIASRGYDVDNFFKKILFTENNPVKVAQMVAEGKAEVGMLRACMLESIERDNPELAGHFRVIEPKQTSDLPCEYSTELYPGWTIGVVNGTQPRITQVIAKALLQMDVRKNDGYTWTLATDFSKVHDVFKNLKTGPYEYLNHWTLRRIVETYWPYLLALLVALASWVLHWWRIEKLVNKRTQQLSVALIKQRESEKRAREISDKLDSMYRTGVINQLSTILAHEMRQPLAAMKYSTRSLQTLIKKGILDDGRIDKVLLTFRSQIERANQILDKVRAYAKGTYSRDKEVEMSALVQGVVEDIQNSQRSKSPLRFKSSGKAVITGDPLELQIAVINLLKNADEANHAGGVIDVDVAKTGNYVALTIINEGDVNDDRYIAEMQKPLKSSKKDGLGLGMQIIKSVAEVHLGELKLTAREQGGLVAQLILPLKQQEETNDKENDQQIRLSDSGN